MDTNTIASFWSAVDRYCQGVAGSVTSGRRTPARNKFVGAPPTSAHLAGLGADVVVDSAVGADERHRLAGELELKLIIEDDHDHLQPAGWSPAPTQET